MKCLIIAGSPRSGGNTDFCAHYIHEGLSNSGINELDLLHLYDVDVGRCIGCRECMRQNRCVIEGDDLDEVMNRVFAADMIIAVAPVYWNAPPGIMKDFIDRTHGWYAHTLPLQGQKACIVSPAADSGWEPHESVMASWLKCYGAKVCEMVRITAREKGDVEKNDAEKMKLDELIGKIASILS